MGIQAGCLQEAHQEVMVPDKQANKPVTNVSGWSSSELRGMRPQQGRVEAQCSGSAGWGRGGGGGSSVNKAEAGWLRG